jgi:hydroxypyruvate reductase
MPLYSSEAESGVAVAFRPTQRLVADALAVWRAGVVAVDSQRLVRRAVQVSDETLRVGSESLALDRIRRIVVVGAGKAGAGMAAGLLDSLGPRLCRDKHVCGWVNVPDDCARELPGVRVFPARPPGQNLPTPQVLDGTREILKLVQGCAPNDLCIGLISGGGSALLDLPVPPVSLADQIALIEHLSAARANIQQLNLVRRRLSLVKGGRLAAACAAPFVVLIISDVLGDPLDVIASGPTVPDSGSAAAALETLREFDPDRGRIPATIYEALSGSPRPAVTAERLRHVRNFVIGNLGVAIEAAAEHARSLGYSTGVHIPMALEGLAEDVGRKLAARIGEQCAARQPTAWIEGGEPVVRLAPPEQRGLGGRNQQVILALAEALGSGPPLASSFCAISGGTDGEDGPTDAAGAWLDSETLGRAAALGLVPHQYLSRNDAYHFFEPLGTLLRTGPTHTNVCDLRVVLSGGARGPDAAP